MESEHQMRARGDSADTALGIACPFAPHPNLGDGINHNIVQSEIEGGVYLRNVPSGNALEIETENRYYIVIHRGQGEVLISGHPVYCPDPVRVKVAGSNWGGSMLKVGFIGRGMHLEFRHPRYHTPIITSRIRQIRDIGPFQPGATASCVGMA